MEEKKTVDEVLEELIKFIEDNGKKQIFYQYFATLKADITKSHTEEVDKLKSAIGQKEIELADLDAKVKQANETLKTVKEEQATLSAIDSPTPTEVQRKEELDKQVPTLNAALVEVRKAQKDMTPIVEMGIANLERQLQTYDIHPDKMQIVFDEMNALDEAHVKLKEETVQKAIAKALK